MQRTLCRHPLTLLIGFNLMLGADIHRHVNTPASRSLATAERAALDRST
jgi:hypothetical protein